MLLHARCMLLAAAGFGRSVVGSINLVDALTCLLSHALLDQRHGLGVYYFTSGRIYEGQWSDGVRGLSPRPHLSAPSSLHARISLSPLFRLSLLFSSLLSSLPPLAPSVITIVI